ncbi:octopamine receptor beta-3R [Nematostella vectensis]|uniref:octopamine receptor beta-3R n=1 Tax=Nematostella vectensis TaxID=45351 RepID=UPI0013906571|nr:octopamine receptor beta-3R [Nematostella vectensis]XP_032223361.1 octopamine receptor beta-3R [Nematostella vectensis]XP_032223363.1 octopamine receptor beta-3R [Nematostella vectensis]XP_032223364.1 octopamine receptor beta-3R [Nematostella vectensis]
MAPLITDVIQNATIAPQPTELSGLGQENHAFNITMMVIQIAVIITALSGNILVCTAILVHERLRSSTTNYFIFSLAVSDIITASIAMPFDVDQILKKYTWEHGEAMCNIFVTSYLVAAPLSMLNLLAVSVDRYHAITQPLQYPNIMTPKVVLTSIFSLWVYAILFTVIAMLAWPLYEKSVFDGACHFNISPWYSLISSVVNFVLPTIVMCLLYFRIYKVAHAHARRIRGHEYSTDYNGHALSTNGTMSGHERKSIRRSIKAAKTIAIIVSAFLLCWMPYTLVSCASVICPPCFHRTPSELFTVTLLLAYINSALNPFLYAFHNTDFRESFRRLFRLQFTFI